MWNNISIISCLAKGIRGVKDILHNANMMMSDRYGDGSLAILMVYLLKPFNMVDRSIQLCDVRVILPYISLWVGFLYGQAAKLYIGMDILCQTLECTKATR